MNKILHLYGKSVCSVLRPQKSLMQSNDLPASLTLDYYDICYVVCVERARAAKGSSINYVPATKLICTLLSYVTGKEGEFSLPYARHYNPLLIRNRS